MKPRAFTLIEVMLSTLILSILLASVAAIAASMSRRTSEKPSASILAEGLVASLERDLSRCHSLQSSADGTRVEMESLSVTTARPVRVVYRVDPKRRELLRAEFALDESTVKTGAERVIAGGIEQIGVVVRASSNATVAEVTISGPAMQLRRWVVLR